jgi:hypothetical protein
VSMKAVSSAQREAICRRIAQAREGAALTPEGLAQHLSAFFGVAVSARDIHRYEKSKVPWSLLDAIGRVTGTSRAWLLYGDAELEHPPLRFDERGGANRDDELGATTAAPWSLSRSRALAGLALGLLLGVTLLALTGSRPVAVLALVATVVLIWLRQPARRS